MFMQKRVLKKTTSLKNIVFDVGSSEEPSPHDQDHPFFDGLDRRRNNRRHSADFLQTASFLRACSLCHRRLVPGRDIFMYKGDSAFCSQECREEQMKQDERKERYSLTASKKQTAAVASAAAIHGETVAAV